ncbi:hypothetical protein ACFY1V_31570 [Streptomyces sp. NPDC001255]|uniref:hypothetical protein n=1 Tax=Streptomyces sp. NPDC001255 TaxID=3364550 RepID=UPI003682A305
MSTTHPRRRLGTGPAPTIPAARDPRPRRVPAEGGDAAPGALAESGQEAGAGPGRRRLGHGGALRI